MCQAVKTYEEDDRLPEEKNPRAQQGDFHALANGHLRLPDVKLAHVDLAGLLRKSFGSAAEQGRGICFGAGEGADDPESQHEECHQSHEPTHALGMAKESTCDGSCDFLSADAPLHRLHTARARGNLTQSRAQERSHSEDRRRHASLSSSEKISNDTSGVGKRCRAKSTGEKAEN